MMEFDEFARFIKGMLEKTNEAFLEMRTDKSIGFAIPIPDGCSEEVKVQMDRALIGIRWSFVRTMIERREYYVLFPLGR